MMLARNFLFCFFFIACQNEYGDPIPIVVFDDITVNLVNHVALQRDGGYLLLNQSNAGVRGIVVYRQNEQLYYAYERNCSYRPNDACATVGVHVSGLFLHDDCCGSSFSFSTGEPSSGPAWMPLRRYRTILNGSVLTITDEILI